MSENTPGLNHQAVLYGFRLRTRERMFEALAEIDELYLKGSSLLRYLEADRAALAEAQAEIARLKAIILRSVGVEPAAAKGGE